MADLGNITGYNISGLDYSLPGWHTTVPSKALSQAGSISGSVAESGVGDVANCLVLLYWRESGHLIKRTWTNADGEFVFSKLDTSKSYTVVAQDPAGGTQYNDLVYALVQPE